MNSLNQTITILSMDIKAYFLVLIALFFIINIIVFYHLLIKFTKTPLLEYGKINKHFNKYEIYKNELGEVTYDSVTKKFFLTLTFSFLGPIVIYMIIILLLILFIHDFSKNPYVLDISKGVLAWELLSIFLILIPYFIAYQILTNKHHELKYKYLILDKNIAKNVLHHIRNNS